MSELPVAAAMRRRRSESAVTDRAPTKRELLPLIEAAAGVADHAALHPWRLIALRGDARLIVGRALARAANLTGSAAEKTAGKLLRAPLVIAIVVSPKASGKVPEWEQEAVASGVAHALSLVLDEAGWGVMWRTGLQARSPEVHRAHGLARQERLLGWLYVGGKRERRSTRRKPVKAKDFLSSL